MMMPGKVAFTTEQTAKLEVVRGVVGTDLEAALTAMLTRPDDSERLGHATRFVELLLAHLCNLLNSEYHCRPRSDPDLEKRLRDLENKALSFGQYAGSFDLFTKKQDGKLLLNERIIPAIVRLAGDPIPEDAARRVREFEIIIDGRGRWELPIHKVEAYVADGISRGMTAKTVLSKFFHIVNRVRNATVHPDGTGRTTRDEIDPNSKAWWHESVEFRQLLVRRLVPMIVDVLLWEPMFQLLTQYEVGAITAQEAEDAGGFRARIERFQRQTPLTQALVYAPVMFDVGSQAVVQRTQDPDRLVWVMRLRTFPIRRDGGETIRQEYRRMLARTLVGRADGDDPGERGRITTESESLAAYIKNNDLSKTEVETLKEDVVRRWVSLCGKSTDHPTPTEAATLLATGADELVRWTIGEETSTDASSVVPAALALMSILMEDVSAEINNRGVVATERLMTYLGVPLAPIACALEALLRKGLITQVGTQGDITLETSSFQRRDPSAAERFRIVLDEVQRDLEQDVALPSYVWSLLRLTDKLLVDASHSSNADRIEPLWDKAQERVAPHAAETPSSGPTETTADEAASTDETLRVTFRGETFEATRLTVLVRRVADHLLNDPALAGALRGAVPHKAGRVRHLVNWTPFHEPQDGKEASPFSYPIAVSVGETSLHFEGNWLRSTGIFHLQAFLGKVEAQLTTMLDPVAAPVGAEAALEETRSLPPVEVVDDEALEESDFEDETPGVDLTLLDGRILRVRGDTVPKFLEQFLKTLTRTEVTASQPLIDTVPLPFAVGRTRYFLAEAPVHLDERPFLRSVEHDGVFAEGSISWETAFENVERYIAATGVDIKVATFEPRRSELPLALRLGSGQLLSGHDVKSFLFSVLETLAAEGHSPAAIAREGIKRYLLHDRPVHPSGKPFKTPLEYEYAGVKYFVECHSPRNRILGYMATDLTRVGIPVLAIGEEALAWAQVGENTSTPFVETA